MKCDERESTTGKDFIRESPFIIVCEGFHDVSFVCALLRHLKINNCDVTFPKKLREGGNGKDKIVETLKGLAGRTAGLLGVLVVWDADNSPDDSFRAAQDAFKFDGAPFYPPPTPFTVRPGRIKTAIYMMPGAGRSGSLEHLLFEAAADNQPKAAGCVDQLCQCAEIDSGDLSENDRAKLRLATMIATCFEDHTCSLGWVWSKKRNPIPIDSRRFKDFSDFITRFTSDEQIAMQE